MVFSSIVFLFYFLPVALALYFLAPRRGKNLVLFAVSLVFYAWGEPVYLFLMLFSILVNYLFGLALANAAEGAVADAGSDFNIPDVGAAVKAECVPGSDKAQTENAGNTGTIKSETADSASLALLVKSCGTASTANRKFCGAALRSHFRGNARVWLIAACAVNLALLGFFKYADFLIQNLNLLPGVQLSPLELPLPLGISFYTFQAMSYIIDLYRGKVEVQRGFIAFGAYVALFPQLIAGPIVRFQTIADELKSRRESAALFSRGALRFTAGLAKKVILANGAGSVFDQITQTAAQTPDGFAGLSALTAWIGILAFTFQIYFDFSGYSDMAIGLGRMLGFHFPENFNYPYVSKSITEFWRRWHITLSTWFREYVYIPLGGNRKGTAKQIRNIAVVWALTGIWHGASWNFLIWGVYFGILLILEKLFLSKQLERLPGFFSHIYTMFFVVISWVIFSIDSVQGISGYLSAMFGLGSGSISDTAGLYLLSNNVLFLLILCVGATPLPKRLWLRLTASAEAVMGCEDAKGPLPAWLSLTLQSAGMAALLLLVTAFLVSSSYNPFLYFRF